MNWLVRFHEWSKTQDPERGQGWYDALFYYYWRIFRVIGIIASIFFGGVVLWVLIQWLRLRMA
jgi:hypothetical protein